MNVLPGWFVILRMEDSPRAVRVVRSLERPCLRAARLIAFPCAAVDFIEIDLLRRIRSEVVCHGNWKIGRGGYDAVCAVGRAGVVVVEEIRADRTAVERPRVRHALAVRVGRCEVLETGGDRTVSGDGVNGQSVSVEVERLARFNGYYAVKRKVVIERGVVRICHAQQFVGKRSVAVALGLEVVARGHGVIKTDGSVGILRGNEVEFQAPSCIIHLERIDVVRRIVTGRIYL